MINVNLPAILRTEYSLENDDDQVFEYVNHKIMTKVVVEGRGEVQNFS